LLERQLRKWKPHPSTPAPEPRPSLQMQQNPQLAQVLAKAAAEAARIDQLQRASVGDYEMDAVADHLAGIPGRKNLIWLANKFPIGPRAIEHLSRAGVSIYPVDIDGVCRLCPERPKDAMDAIAALTGGVAYYGRNDIDVAIREAMDDGLVSYTLGFYPSSDDSLQVHRLSVKVSRPGVTLRYRTSIAVEPPHPESTSADPIADLVQALNRPVDATAIPIEASVTRANDRLNLEAMLDVDSLILAQDNNLWTCERRIRPDPDLEAQPNYVRCGRARRFSLSHRTDHAAQGGGAETTIRESGLRENRDANHSSGQNGECGERQMSAVSVSPDFNLHALGN
jgi:hypothetical protein